jgi:hypothetical protein
VVIERFFVDRDPTSLSVALPHVQAKKQLYALMVKVRSFFYDGIEAKT